MPEKYNSKKDVGDTLQLLVGILDKITRVVQHLDSQANILIGLGSALFVFSATRVMNNDGELAFGVLGFFTLLSSLVGLFAIHPPKFMRKRGQVESVMYNKQISSFGSPDAYEQSLRDLAGDNDAIIRQFAVEIFNMATYYYRPKRNLFTLARNLLLAGVIVFALIVVAQ